MLQLPNDNNLAMYRRVGEAICDAVRAGRIEPGEMLPARAVLAEQLGVSTASINVACQWLEKRGVVSSRRGRGSQSGTRIQPDALRRLEEGGRRFESIFLVAGVSRLADCDREYGFLFNQILAGVSEAFGPVPPRVKCVPELDRAFLERLPADSAVLLKRPSQSMERRADPVVIDELVRRGVPIVSVWHSPPLFDVPHVCYDPRQAVDLACRHLIECGYRRIGYIGDKGREDVWLGVKFMQFTDTLQEAGLDFRTKDVREVRGVRYDLGCAYEAARQIATSGDPPEALFIDTDYKAIEALHALRDFGLRVPEDIAVMGHDDAPEAAVVDPPLTTVRVPREGIGRRAAEIIHQWPEGGGLPDTTTAADNTLRAELVVRRTTAPANARREAETTGLGVSPTSA